MNCTSIAILTLMWSGARGAYAQDGAGNYQKINEKIGQVQQDVRDAASEAGRNSAEADGARAEFAKRVDWVRKKCEQTVYCNPDQPVNYDHCMKDDAIDCGKGQIAYRNYSVTKFVSQKAGKLGDDLNEHFTGLLLIGRCAAGLNRDIRDDQTGRIKDSVLQNAQPTIAKFNALGQGIEERIAKSRDAVKKLEDVMGKWGITPSQGSGEGYESAAGDATNPNSAIRSGDNGYDSCEKLMQGEDDNPY